MVDSDTGTDVVGVGPLRFRVTVRGPEGGVPVVLLHGFPQTAAAWGDVTPHLSAGGCRTIAFDQRGYSPGARPGDVEAYRVAELAKDAIEVASAAGADRFHVVGHDWGGVIAWHLAAHHADRLISATSVSTPHPAALRVSMVRSLQPLRSSYIAFFNVPAVPERILLAGGGTVLRRILERSGLPPPRAAAYADSMGEPGALTAALNWYRANTSIAVRPPPPSVVPTLYMWGDRDRALGPTAARATAGYVEAPYRFRVLRGASHWLPETRPWEVADLVRNHVDSSGKG